MAAAQPQEQRGPMVWRRTPATCRSGEDPRRSASDRPPRRALPVPGPYRVLDLLVGRGIRDPLRCAPILPQFPIPSESRGSHSPRHDRTPAMEEPMDVEALLNEKMKGKSKLDYKVKGIYLPLPDPNVRKLLLKNQLKGQAFKLSIVVAGTQVEMNPLISLFVVAVQSVIYALRKARLG